MRGRDSRLGRYAAEACCAGGVCASTATRTCRAGGPTAARTRRVHLLAQGERIGCGPVAEAACDLVVLASQPGIRSGAGPHRLLRRTARVDRPAAAAGAPAADDDGAPGAGDVEAAAGAAATAGGDIAAARFARRAHGAAARLARGAHGAA